jgi:7-cyano-7-deazaguanine reductase
VKTYKDADELKALLKAIPYDGGALEISHHAGEVTFLGVPDQPDFGVVDFKIYPSTHVPELKSLKEYFFGWRDVVVSYERFIDVVFEHLMEVYRPDRLRITLRTNVRGGISSTLTIDSDWAVRGGEERYRDWQEG